MNTVKSVYYGWGALIVAGGGAYFFAKRSIDADRAAKFEADHKRRVAQYQLEQQHLQQSQNAQQSALKNTSNLHQPVNSQHALQTSATSTPASQTTSQMVAQARASGSGGDWVEGSGGGPSQEASQDPAPTRHAPEDEAQRVGEKSKYEASDVFRSRKGDRFS